MENGRIKQQKIEKKRNQVAKNEKNRFLKSELKQEKNRNENGNLKT